MIEESRDPVSRQDRMDINTHANAVNVAGEVTVDEQNITIGGTAEVVKLSDTSERRSWRDSNNVTHTINNYNYAASTPVATLPPPWPSSNAAASYIINRTGLRTNSVAWNVQGSKFTSVEYDKRQKDEV